MSIIRISASLLSGANNFIFRYGLWPFGVISISDDRPEEENVIKIPYFSQDIRCLVHKIRLFSLYVVLNVGRAEDNSQRKEENNSGSG